MAEQLGAAQVRETQLEARMQTEITRFSAEIESLKESYSSEVKNRIVCHYPFLWHCNIYHVIKRISGLY